MRASGQETAAAASTTRIALLVALAMFISYVDRGNLATAATAIQDELRLTPEQLGFLLSAFYATYVLAMIPAGWLAERHGAHAVLAGGLLIWSLATLATGFAASFGALLLLRLLLGLGESVTFPSMSKLISSGVPAGRLAEANGLVAFGYLIGPAVGTLVGGLLITQLGWRPVFVLLGCLSLLWLLPWRRTVIREPRLKDPTQAGPSFREVLRQRSLWGTSLGLFSMNYAYYLILSWLPVYLIRERGFSLSAMAALASGAYLMNALAAYVSGWATDRWIRAGHSVTFTYKAILAVYHVGGIVCMIGIVKLPVAASIACLYIYQLIIGIGSPGTFAVSQIFAGPSASARWVGVQNMCGNVAGIVAPAVTGLVVGATGHFDRAFFLAAAVNVLGLIGWIWMLPRIAPIEWRK
jgi:MFS family permease